MTLLTLRDFLRPVLPTGVEVEFVEIPEQPRTVTIRVVRDELAERCSWLGWMLRGQPGFRFFPFEN